MTQKRPSEPALNIARRFVRVSDTGDTDEGPQFAITIGISDEGSVTDFVRSEHIANRIALRFIKELAQAIDAHITADQGGKA